MCFNPNCWKPGVSIRAARWSLAVSCTASSQYQRVAVVVCLPAVECLRDLAHLRPRRSGTIRLISVLLPTPLGADARASTLPQQGSGEQRCMGRAGRGRFQTERGFSSQRQDVDVDALVRLRSRSSVACAVVRQVDLVAACRVRPAGRRLPMATSERVSCDVAEGRLARPRISSTWSRFAAKVLVFHSSCRYQHVAACLRPRRSHAWSPDWFPSARGRRRRSSLLLAAAMWQCTRSPAGRFDDHMAAMRRDDACTPTSQARAGSPMGSGGRGLAGRHRRWITFEGRQRRQPLGGRRVRSSRRRSRRRDRVSSVAGVVLVELQQRTASGRRRVGLANWRRRRPRIRPCAI